MARWLGGVATSGGVVEGEESDQEELASRWLAQGVAERSAIERRGTGDRDLRWQQRFVDCDDGE
ncbi:hypothetical protein E2562_017141 [Oryza meyeriana var. granulata]|uniref:Uncharacterized protein n=1 Tax=Oryza meyeriana var. granulata TaxID=110450 RepID=A0A6G1DZX7_9ORYZ|nr:hypothetical protein E2562_017140 [Oryza meyeriana var. granulata]KAF0917253.1 hypothetical protein E2562_017141 [Oryza meyeriana var. granulata]